MFIPIFVVKILNCNENIYWKETGLFCHGHVNASSFKIVSLLLQTTFWPKRQAILDFEHFINKIAI